MVDCTRAIFSQSVRASAAYFAISLLRPSGKERNVFGSKSAIDSSTPLWKRLLLLYLTFNPLKVCHTKIDRMRSMGFCPLNSVVCRRMATKLPRKLPNAFLYSKLKSFRGVHIQLLAEIGG